MLLRQTALMHLRFEPCLRLYRCPPLQGHHLSERHCESPCTPQTTTLTENNSQREQPPLIFQINLLPTQPNPRSDPLLQVRGAVEILRNFFASLAASFSGMCSSLPALGHIIGATLGGFQLAFEQIKALVAQLDAPPMLSSLLVNLLSTCCAATAIFAAGVAVFVLCLALSGLSFVASISLTLTSGILFSFSTFLAFAGGMLVIPAMVISGIGSVALAAAAVPYRITNAKKAAESDEDHDALTTEDLKDEGFVSVSSPSDKKSINGGFFGSLWKRKAGPIDSSLQPEAQQALREGRAVLS